MTGRNPRLDVSRLAGLGVVVAGAGVTGTSARRHLAALGARVTVLDDRDGSAAAGLPPRTGLVVVSPGWRPDHPLLAAAAADGVPVWGDVELAWRLACAPGRPAAPPWLVVTGTNGKTTTTGMLAAVLTAAGATTVATGNIGLPVLDAVLAEPAYDVLAVELSSFQLHWAPSVVPFAGAVLNVAADHLDWHGSATAYAASKLRALGDARTIAVGVADDPGSAALIATAPSTRRVLVRASPPAAGELGVADGPDGAAVLLDRAFTAFTADGPGGAGEVLAAVADVPALRAPHDATNALVAAALARAYGVPAAAVGRGLAAYRPGPHRVERVGVVAGVGYVDDSKATNPHAALASVTAYPSVIWIAGGLNKGLGFDELAAAARGHVRAAVLLGSCREQIAAALARHAPQIPVIRVPDLDHGVREAARLARTGDTVLLAPAAASFDMFRDYAERGEVFAAAVRRLADREDSP